LSVLSIALNAAVGLLAVTVALSSGSLSLLGFGFDSAIDGAASVALVWRFSIETKQPHRAESVERVAEIVVGAVLLVLAVYLGISAISALAARAHPESSFLAIAIPVFSLIALPPLALAKYRTARDLGSGALRADSLLTGVAAALAVVSLAGIVLSASFGLTWADAVGALVVTAILAREGWYSIRASRTPEPGGPSRP
jgi:divalent metal cation (Fe/Co/Zn/Cd) transporter